MNRTMVASTIEGELELVPCKEARKCQYKPEQCERFMEVALCCCKKLIGIYCEEHGKIAFNDLRKDLNSGHAQLYHANLVHGGALFPSVQFEFIKAGWCILEKKGSENGVPI